MLEGLYLGHILAGLFSKISLLFLWSENKFATKGLFFSLFFHREQIKLFYKDKNKLPKHYGMCSSNYVLNNYHSFCTAMASFMVDIVFRIKVCIGDGAVP